MKLGLLQVATLTAVVALSLAIGYRPTAARWGAPGITSMWAAVIICWSAALVAALVVIVVMRLSPAYVGQAAFAGVEIDVAVARADATTGSGSLQRDASSFQSGNSGNGSERSGGQTSGQEGRSDGQRNDPAREMRQDRAGGSLYI